ncbi:hypothetical protein [Sphingobacterium faecale]|nr:hypothetical protein [Sphingobacterium faecale]
MNTDFNKTEEPTPSYGHIFPNEHLSLTNTIISDEDVSRLI